MKEDVSGKTIEVRNVRNMIVPRLSIWLHRDVDEMGKGE